jgi:hypothetical protein
MWHLARSTTALSCAALLLAGAAHGQTPAWSGFAGNARHTAIAPASPQTMAHFHWTTPVDLQPQATDGDLLIHYGSPMITVANTVLLPVKTGALGGFRIEAHDSGNGTLLWQHATDYQLPAHDWIPPLPAALTPRNRLYVAGIGGTVIARDTPDLTTGRAARVAFYGLAEWQADKAAYNSAVQISTPITSDGDGDIYFGFMVSGVTPAKLQSGIARIAPDGTGSWTSAATAAGDASITQVAMNCAPAVSHDGKTIYIAVTGGSEYLVGLDATTLAPKYRATLFDPSSGQTAWVDGDSSASPTVGPDGDVFYGVLEEPFPNHDGRGWLLHFDATLAISKTPGSFGWDNTVSVLPATAVPSYTGTSKYLLTSKYNNYLGVGPYGDGHNRIAILDPHAAQLDAYSSVQVLTTVQSVLGPTPDPDGPPGAVYEWCIDSAVVDPVSGSLIANSEDGHVYRWDLASNTLAEALQLNPPQSEAYTPTLIGPDGTVYAINDSTLYAIGN